MTITKYQVKEVNCATGDEIIRDATIDETAQLNSDAANSAAAKAEAEATATAKADLLARLGITADEAKLLLGGN